MGLNTPAAPRTATMMFELASKSFIPISAWVTLIVALSVAASLALWGWRDIWFVIVAPSPPGIGAALLASLVLLAVAVPIVTVAAFCAAASLWDSRIGGRATKMLVGWLPWASGLPPVVVGSALYFLLVLLAIRLSLVSAALGLIVLNTPAACARMLRILRMTPPALHEAAAAAGGGAVFVLFRVSLPRAARELLASIAQAAAEMSGQAAVIILAGGILGNRAPLPVQIWHFAPNRSLANVEAAQCMILLLVIVMFALLSDALAGRQKERATST